MHVRIIISLYVFFFQQLFFVKIQARETCYYRGINSTTVTISCNDDCCASLAPSPETACCSTISWGSIAIPFFVFVGICTLAACLVYCRPLWKTCFCGLRCPCGTRRRVASPSPVPATVNPIYILNNDDLPDYETIVKDPVMKDGVPPPYNFVTTHPDDFGIAARVPSAPPQYHSRRSSLTTTQSGAPENV